MSREEKRPFEEILKLYDFDNSPATRQQINGIVSLQSQHVTRRIGQSFCRGVQVTLEFDEDKFVGTGLFLFASVLERFLGQYVSVNSFSQLVAKTVQRKEAVEKVAPEKRQSDSPLKDRLFEEFYRFSFFQAVHLLEMLFPGKKPLGQTLTPARRGGAVFSETGPHVSPQRYFEPETGGRAEAGRDGCRLHGADRSFRRAPVLVQ